MEFKMDDGKTVDLEFDSGGTGWSGDTYYVDKKPTTLPSNGTGKYSNGYYIEGKLTKLSADGTGSWKGYFYIAGVVTTLDAKGNGHWLGDRYKNGIIQNDPISASKGIPFARVVRSDDGFDKFWYGTYKGEITYYESNASNTLDKMDTLKTSIHLNGAYFYGGKVYFFKGGEIVEPKRIDNYNNLNGDLLFNGCEPLELKNYYTYFKEKGKISYFGDICTEKRSDNLFIYDFENCVPGIETNGSVYSSNFIREWRATRTSSSGPDSPGASTLPSSITCPKIFFSSWNDDYSLVLADGFFSFKDEKVSGMFVNGFRVKCCKEKYFEDLYKMTNFDRNDYRYNIFSLKTNKKSLIEGGNVFNVKFFTFSVIEREVSVKTSVDIIEKGFEIKTKTKLSDGFYIDDEDTRKAKIILENKILNIVPVEIKTSKNKSKINLVTWAIKNQNGNDPETIRKTSPLEKLSDPMCTEGDVEFEKFLKTYTFSFLNTTKDGRTVSKYREIYFCINLSGDVFTVYNNVWYFKGQGNYNARLITFYSGFEEEIQNNTVRPFYLAPSLRKIDENESVRIGSAPFTYILASQVSSNEGGESYNYDNLFHGGSPAGLFINGVRGILPFSFLESQINDLFIKSQAPSEYSTLVEKAGTKSNYDSETYETILGYNKKTLTKYDKIIPFNVADLFILKTKDQHKFGKFISDLLISNANMDICPDSTSNNYIYKEDDKHYSYNPIFGLGEDDFWSAFNNLSSSQIQKYKRKPANGPYSLGLFYNGYRASREQIFGAGVENELPMLTINSFSYRKDIVQRYWISYNHLGFPTDFRPNTLKDEVTGLSLSRTVFSVTLANGTFGNGTFANGLSMNANAKNAGTEKFSEEMKPATTEAEISATYEKLHNSTTINNAVDVINGTSRQVVTVDKLPSKTYLDTAKFGKQQLPVQSPTYQAVKNHSVYYFKNTNTKKTAVKLNGISLQGAFNNGIELTDPKFLIQFKKIPLKITIINSEENPNSAEWKAQRDALGKYVVWDGQKWDLANGNYLGRMHKSSNENGFGGYFVNGVRTYAEPNLNSPYPHTEDGVRYTINGNYAEVAQGLWIINGVGPYFKNGKVDSVPDGQKVAMEPIDGTNNFQLPLGQDLEQCVGRNIDTNKIFYVSSGGNVVDLEIGVDYMSYSTSSSIATEGLITETVSTKRYFIEVVAGKETLAWETISSDTTTRPNSPSGLIQDAVPRKDGGSWFVYGGNLDTESNIIKTDKLDEDGNGFIPHQHPVKVIYRETSYNGPEKIKELDSKFAAYRDIKDESDPINYGVFYIQGHPQEFTKNKIKFLSNAISNLQAPKRNAFVGLSQFGNGFLTLRQLKAINYDFSKVDGKIDFTFNWRMTKYSTFSGDTAGNLLNRKTVSLGQDTPALFQGLPKDKYYIDIEKDGPTSKVSIKDIIDKIDEIKIKTYTINDDTNAATNFKRGSQTFTFEYLEKLTPPIIYDVKRQTLKEIITELEGIDPNFNVEDYILIQFRDGNPTGLYNLEKVWQKYQSKLNGYYYNWVTGYVFPEIIELDAKDDFKLKTYPEKDFFANVSVEGFISKEVLESVDAINFIEREGLLGSLSKFYPFYFMNSMIYEDVFTPDGSGFHIEEDYADYLNEKGSGFANNVYWINYSPTSLDQNGDGFWLNTEFKGGKIV